MTNCGKANAKTIPKFATWIMINPQKMTKSGGFIIGFTDVYGIAEQKLQGDVVNRDTVQWIWISRYESICFRYRSEQFRTIEWSYPRKAIWVNRQMDLKCKKKRLELVGSSNTCLFSIPTNGMMMRRRMRTMLLLLLLTTTPNWLTLCLSHQLRDPCHTHALDIYTYIIYTQI